MTSNEKFLFALMFVGLLAEGIGLLALSFLAFKSGKSWRS